MKFFTVMIILYNAEGFGDVETHLLFTDAQACAEAIEPMYDLLARSAAHDDLAVLCHRTTRLSTTVRPKARP